MRADDLLRKLEQDPAYQQRMNEKLQRAAVLQRLLEADEAPLVNELSRVAGRSISSVWDLVNTSDAYPELVGILAEHLARPYHVRTREGIARALTCKEARPFASRVLDALEGSTSNADPHEASFRFALANALLTMNDRSLAPRLERLVTNADFLDVRSVLLRCLNKQRR